MQYNNVNELPHMDYMAIYEVCNANESQLIIWFDLPYNKNITIQYSKTRNFDFDFSVLEFCMVENKDDTNNWKKRWGTNLELSNSFVR